MVSGHFGKSSIQKRLHRYLLAHTAAWVRFLAVLDFFTTIIIIIYFEKLIASASPPGYIDYGYVIDLTQK